MSDRPDLPPGAADLPGKYRFRWRYTMWYKWPQDPPTRQDLADFRFTNWVLFGLTAVLVLPALAWWLLRFGRSTADVWLITWGIILAVAITFPAYLQMAKRDWQRRQP